MSDLQDLIATNAVRAYNEGFERGATEERERIADILDGWHVSLCRCDVCKAVREISNTIKAEQK